jgi:hypothetical protein
VARAEQLRAAQQLQGIIEKSHQRIMSLTQLSSDASHERFTRLAVQNASPSGFARATSVPDRTSAVTRPNTGAVSRPPSASNSQSPFDVHRFGPPPPGTISRTAALPTWSPAIPIGQVSLGNTINARFGNGPWVHGSGSGWIPGRASV